MTASASEPVWSYLIIPSRSMMNTRGTYNVSGAGTYERKMSEAALSCTAGKVTPRPVIQASAAASVSLT